MPYNFEQLPNTNFKQLLNTNTKKEVKPLTKTIRLEDAPPGTNFTLDGRPGKVVGVITKEENVKKNVEVAWLDVTKGTGVDRIDGKTPVQVKEEPKKELELEETILGEAKPRQKIYITNPETGEKTRIRMITNLSKGKDIKVLINGKQEFLPWNTSVFVEKEKEFE